MSSLDIISMNLQTTTREYSSTYNEDLFTFNFFGLSTLGAGVAPELLVNVGMPAEGDVCPGAALAAVNYMSTVTEGTSCPITASSPTTCVLTPCFESLGFALQN